VRVWLVVAVVLTGCRVGNAFKCQQDADCQLSTGRGTCEPSGYCAFPDVNCPSGARYDVDSGDLGGKCVGSEIDAGIDSTLHLYKRLIHLGGPMVVGTDYPGTWEADPGNGFCPASSQSTIAGDVNNTVDDALFQPEIWGLDIKCAFPFLPSGHYHITLPLAEEYFGCMAGAQNRVVTVKIEGANVGTLDFDALGGGCAIAPGPGHPFLAVFDHDVTDGTLNLELSSGDTAVVYAIAIEQTP
jgi:hypothetical protein